MTNQSPKWIAHFLDAYRGLPRQVWLLCGVLLVNRCGTMVLPFWTLYCKSERGFGDLQVGWLLAIYGIGSVIGSTLGGWLTTRIGPFRVQTLSLLSTGIGFLLLMQVETFYCIAAVFLALSIVAETIRPASATAVANLCEKRLHPRAMALNRLAINLGMSLGPAMGGFLADRDFGLLFLFDGISCLSAGGLLLYIFGFKDEVIPVGRRRGKFWHPWTDKKFAAFGFCNFLIAIVFFQILGTYVLYLHEVFQLEKSSIGVLMAINTLVIVVFEMVLVRRVERYDSLRVVAIGFLLSGVGVCLIPFGRGVAWAVFSILVWTMGEMLSMPLGAAFAASRAAPDERGNYMGAYSMTYALAFVVGPLSGMWAYHINPDYVWYAGLALTAVATVGAWMLSTVTRKQAPASADGQTEELSA